jgi:hypothetical protein
MSEEKPTGFRTENAGPRVKRITSIGRDPWLVRKIDGVVRFKRPDASQLKVQPLDPNGAVVGDAGRASEIKLSPDRLYYLITSGD